MSSTTVISRFLPLLVLVLGLALGPTAAAWAQRDARAEGYYQTGMALKKDQKYASAVEQFRAAVKLDPNYADAYWGMAWCYVSLGKDEAAIEAFRWVIRLAPETENGVEAAKSIERIRLRRPDLSDVAPEPDSFLIALTMVREGNEDVYLADAEGVVKRRLTTEAGADTQPAFSADARQIVFVSARTGNRDLWVIKADGTGLQQLTDDPAADYSPTWWPQGPSVVFVSERSGRPALYELDLVSNQVRALDQTSSRDLTPAWSPTGNSLAFVSDRDGVEKIYLWDRATRTARKLLANSIPEQRPVWSPDGEYLYFTWELEGIRQICRVRASGEGLEAVAPSPHSQLLWGLSPAGDLLLTSDRTGSSRLYLQPPDLGTGTVRAVGQANLETPCAAVSPPLPRSVAQLLLTIRPSAPTTPVTP